MSTSLLYHGFGIRGYDLLTTEYAGSAVYFHVEQRLDRCRCSQCGSRELTFRGSKRRQWRTLPIGDRPVWIVLDIPRVYCPHCDVVRQVAVSFADPEVRYTRRFAAYVVQLCRTMTMQDVAHHLGVSWDMVKGIEQRHLERKYARPRLKDIRRIAIDEISIAKGHRYVTLVLDLATGIVVYVGDGKGQDALEPFWRKLRASGAKVRAVAIDMSKAYIAAVQKHLPKAKLVFDHFHVIQLFNEKLTLLRRKLYQELTKKLHRSILKGVRWLLLKNPENLDDTKNERQRLQEALDFNQPLALAYYMREDLRQIWDQPNKRIANGVLQDWIRRAEASGERILKSMSNTLAAYRTGILAWYDHPISTGRLEGTNNKIKTMKRQAYGFRDHEFFKLKIKGIHEAKYRLVG